MSPSFMISSPFHIEAYSSGGVSAAKVPRFLAYQVWTGFSEAADQFRGPTNLWAGNRNSQQIHFQVGRKKKNHIFFKFPICGM